MTSWSARSAEERTLLNPSFSGVLLWESALGHANANGSAMPIELAFLVLPLVLHRETREALPKSSMTSLPTWLSDVPLVRTRIGERARALTPFTKEALLLGGTHGLFALNAQGVSASVDWRKRIASVLKDTSDEVRQCAKRAEFVGKWFERAGRPETVMALLGVQP